MIELMVTIAIFAILVSMAAPSFQTMLMNGRLSAQSDGLINALNYARNAALSGNVATLVCPVGAANSTVCGASWSAGWMILSDPAGTRLLLQSASTAANAPVLASVAFNGGAAASVSFDARGLAGSSAYFKTCDSRGAAFARSVQVLPTGFVQAGPTPGQAVWGGSLVCP